VPHVPKAAPWNPPYQPGPGLDAKPAVEWAAGAGLDSVWSDAASSVKALLGQPIDGTPLVVTQAEVYAAFDPTASLNTREMAIGLELPDWSSWLPILHPLDVWTPASDGASGLFETGYQGNAPLAALLAIESWLEANKNPNGAYGDWSHLSASQRNEIQGLFPSLGGQTAAFGGGGQGSRISSDPSNPYGVQLGAQALQALLSAATVAQADLSGCGPTGPCTSFNTDSFIERANLSLYRWLAVKQWESVESYGLQAQSQFHGEVDASGNWAGQGEARGWPYGWPSVFYAAPRILSAPTVTPEGKRENYFSWENRVTSFYRSNAWAELQVTVNPGWAGASNGAIDWPNDLGFIQALSDDLNAANAPSWIAATHLMRFFANLSKLSELANTDLAFDRPDPNNPSNFYANSGWQSKADLLFKVSPSTVLDNGTSQPSRFRVLDQVMPGLYLMFVNGMISNYDALYTGTTRSQYRVCDPTNLVLGGPEQYSGMRFCIDAARTPLPLDSNAQPYCPYPADNGFTTEQYSVWGALAARQLGADAALVQRWSDWNDRMWPN
jgi:hypothetical protein